MLAAAALGIAVLGPEGLATVALQAADLVVGQIEDAVDLFSIPLGSWLPCGGERRKEGIGNEHRIGRSASSTAHFRASKTCPFSRWGRPESVERLSFSPSSQPD